MSEVKVNKITPTADCGTVTLGDSGDTIAIPSGTTVTAPSANVTNSGTVNSTTITNSGTLTNSGTITNTGTISGGTISGNIDGQVSWQTTVKTTAFTATAGEGYFCNTTSAAFTVTLPASPSAGDIVGIKDYANTADTNNITIGRNGSNIQGTANDFIISTEGLSIVLLYVDSTKGWLSVGQAKASDISQAPVFTVATGGTITTSGDFKIHTFTGPGTFTVTQLGNKPTIPAGGPSNVDYRVVAGGGNGGTAYYSGGGGAGGHRTTFPSPSCNAGSFPVSAQAYPITVGAGGAGVETPDAGSASDINPGSNSIFSSITSAGGGGGTPLNVQDPADAGGSGGGAGGYNLSGGAGNTPPVSPPQGNPGGNGALTPAGGGGGGGGGAGSAGTNGTAAPSATAGNGGNGLANSITGSSVTLAGGGGAGGFCGGTSNIPGGSGGPGGGGDGDPDTGVSGTANTGGGGGAVGGRSPGSAPFQGGSGGSGIVVIRYKFQ